jgi:tRNA/tmRNA/rRNA uracil-C5-methylase (TrmA/RlmC/RlmD family)
MELNETFKVTIDSYDINGYGVCHINKKIDCAEGALLGETVIIKITDIHKNFCCAKKIKGLEKSEHRI